MSDEFIPITTQDEFNERIKERIARERAKFEKQLEEFADYAELKAKADGVDEAIEQAVNAAVSEADSRHAAELEKFADYEDLKGKVTEFETNATISALKREVAAAHNVPEAALVGSSKEELEAHAAVLKPLINSGPVVTNPGDTPADAKPSEERAFVRGLFGGD